MEVARHSVAEPPKGAGCRQDDSRPLPGGSTAEIEGGTGATKHTLHADWLGSSRLAISYVARTEAYDTSYAPFGKNPGATNAELNFTGQSQDTLKGLYDFLYRKYSPVQGRWLTPDPAGLGAVNPGDPQTWNRYAYVRNSPLNRIDPQGLDDGGCDPDDPDCGGGPDPCDDGGCGGGGGGGGAPPIIDINLGNNGPSVGYNGFAPCSGDSLGRPCAATLPNPGVLLGCDFGVCDPTSVQDFTDGITCRVECTANNWWKDLKTFLAIVAAIEAAESQAAKDTAKSVYDYGACLTQFTSDLKACVDAYPPGPQRQSCFEAARQKFRLCKAGGKIQ